MDPAPHLTLSGLAVSSCLGTSPLPSLIGQGPHEPLVPRQAEVVRAAAWLGRTMGLARGAPSCLPARDWAAVGSIYFQNKDLWDPDVATATTLSTYHTDTQMTVPNRPVCLWHVRMATLRTQSCKGFA